MNVLFEPDFPTASPCAGQSMTGGFLFETSCFQVYCFQKQESPVYYIKSTQEQELIEIPQEVFQILEEERLQKIRWQNERRRHLDGRYWEDVCEYLRADCDPQLQCDQREQLGEIARLLKQSYQIQRRRFVLHQIYGYTCQEIALQEGCHPSAVSQSVNQIRKKLRQFQKE